MRNSAGFSALLVTFAALAALAAVLFQTGCPREPEKPAAEVAPLVIPQASIVASPSAGDAVDGVRFGREGAKVGDRSHQHVFAKSTWSDDAGMETASYESEFVLEVVAVEGPAPSRVRIEFRKNENFDNVSHQATPIDGHTYLVDVHAPHVLDARTNAPPSEDEIARVSDVLPDLGTRAQIDQVLPDGVMKPGEHRDDIARAIARILHPRIWSMDKGTAVLARSEQGSAIFQVTLAATSSATGMKIDVKGDAHVRLRDARLEGFALAGEFVRANGEKGEFTVSRKIRDD